MSLFVGLNRCGGGDRAPPSAVAAVSVVWLRHDPAGCNGAVENVLSLDGGAACSGRKERSDRGHVC